MFTRLIFRSPRSTPPMYVRSSPQANARPSCDNPFCSRSFRSRWPNFCFIFAWSISRIAKYDYGAAHELTDYEYQAKAEREKKWLSATVIMRRFVSNDLPFLRKRYKKSARLFLGTGGFLQWRVDCRFNDGPFNVGKWVRSLAADRPPLPFFCFWSATKSSTSFLSSRQRFRRSCPTNISRTRREAARMTFAQFESECRTGACSWSTTSAQN